MNNKLESNVYMTVFIISFIGFIIAFFLGVWVGGKSAVKRATPVQTVQNGGKIMTSYEEPVEEESLSQQLQETTNEKQVTANSPKKDKAKKTKPKKTKTEKTTKTKKTANGKTEKTKTNEKQKKAVKPKTKDKRFMLQIGAFNRLEDAEKLKKRFEKKGYSVFVIKEKGKKKVFYKVRIGVFYSKKIALKVKSKIKREDGINPWLVPID